MPPLKIPKSIKIVEVEKIKKKTETFIKTCVKSV